MLSGSPLWLSWCPRYLCVPTLRDRPAGGQCGEGKAHLVLVAGTKAGSMFHHGACSTMGQFCYWVLLKKTTVSRSCSSDYSLWRHLSFTPCLHSFWPMIGLGGQHKDELTAKTELPQGISCLLNVKMWIWSGGMTSTTATCRICLSLLARITVPPYGPPQH